MSKQLKLQVVLDALDKASAPLRRINKSISKQASALKEAKSKLKEYNKSLGEVNNYKSMSSKALQLHQAMKKANKYANTEAKILKKVRNNPKNSAEFIKRFEKRFNDSVKSAQKATKAFREQNGKVRKLKRTLRNNGVDVKNLSGYHKDLKGKIEASTNSVNKHKSALERLNKLSRSSQKIKAFGAKWGRRALYAGGAALAGGTLFTKGLIDTASEFERYQTILKTVEGSNEKAKAAMSWVSDFAVKTPFELGEVMDSFVRLRSYGLDPTNGLLETLGDTAAAMGKPLSQAVEAIADALTGENERLKEFGITGSTKGDTVTYSYTDSAGVQQFKKVMKNDRKAIEQALDEIWREKYGGAAAELSATWAGMISNLKDQWGRFQLAIMNSGLFDLMKTKLRGLLDRIDRMAANGQLEAFARKIGNTIKDTINSIVSFSKKVYAFGQSANEAAQYVGGFDNVLRIVGVSIALKKLSDLVSVGKNITSMLGGLGKKNKTFGKLSKGVKKMASAFKIALTVLYRALIMTGKAMLWMARVALAALYKTLLMTGKAVRFMAVGVKLLGRAFLLNPIALLVTAIATAVYLLYQNWDKVAEWFKNTTIGKILIGLWEKAKQFGDYLGIDLGAMFNALKEFAKPVLKWLVDKIDSLLGILQKAKEGFEEIMGMSGEDWKETGKNFIGAGDGPSGLDAMIDAVGSVFGREPTYGRDKPLSEIINSQKVGAVDNSKKTQINNVTINANTNATAAEIGAKAVEAITESALMGDVFIGG